MYVMKFLLVACYIKMIYTSLVDYQHRKYLDSDVFAIFQNYGPSKCAKECARRSQCYAVNYLNSNLSCELLEVSNTENRERAEDSYSYAEKSTWKLDKDACWPNPCSIEKKCVITHSNTHICVKVNLPSKPKDCSELPTGSRSRVYTIYPEQSNGIKVYCDMVTDGGNWTVFQRRQDGSVDFFRGWDDYEQGFGDVASEFWIGNVNLHTMTKVGDHQLRVDMEDWDGNARYALYNTFNVGDTLSKYQLSVGGYSGNAGDSLSYHNNMKFSTKDTDHDIIDKHCAVIRSGAWWYKGCYHSNLNAIYQPGVSTRDSVSWQTFTGKKYSLKTTRMMIRRI